MASRSPSHSQPELDDLDDVDRKQHGMKQEHGIKVSCDAIQDEQDIACDILRFLVALPPARDLLLHAKDLFIADGRKRPQPFAGQAS